MKQQPPTQPLVFLKGRGANSNPDNRFSSTVHERCDDGWWQEEIFESIATEVRPNPARSIVTRNQSPDVGFNLSINPYQGCEHGCIYCFARPSHSYLDMSPGLDFETRLFYKENAAELLVETFRRRSYQCEPIAIGANTDPYQPIERQYRITRQLLEVALEYRQPVAIITKSSLIERDLDLLCALAEQRLIAVMVSLTSLDAGLKRTLEPRAASPKARLRIIRALSEAGIPVGALVAPVIPVITDPELERILAAAKAAGATRAGYVLLRLPWEVKDLFKTWLAAHHPLKAQHVMSIIRQSRGGKDYDSRWGKRGRGTGQFADLLAQRFYQACRKLELNKTDFVLDTSRFTPPPRRGDQMNLWQE